MRVAIIVSSLEMGGTERVAVNLSAALTDVGWDVALITLADAAGDFFVCPKEVTRFALDRLSHSHSPAHALVNNLRTLLSLRRAVRSFGADSVLALGDRNNALAALATAGIRARVVGSERTDPGVHRPPFLWRIARRLAYRRLSGLVVQTPNARAAVADIIDVSRVVVIPNWVDPPTPRSDEPASQPGPPTILGAGRQNHHKGFDTLVDAFAIVAARHPTVELVLVGDGPDHAGLADALRANGLAKRARLTGAVADVRPHLRHATVVVVPSRLEGFPNLLLEALSEGCAVVATNCRSGPADILEGSRYGILVPVDDADAMAQAICELLLDAERRTALQEHAPKRAAEFTRARVLPLWIAVLEGSVS